jgi:hypothetical protein
MPYQLIRNTCFICNKDLFSLSKDSRNGVVGCSNSDDNKHALVYWIEDGNVSKVQTKVTSNGSSFCLVLDYKNDISEAWAYGNFDTKIKVKGTFVIDMWSVQKLCDRIKTIITFA